MAGDISPNDLKTIQNGLVDQLITPESLPGPVRDRVFQYMGQQGIDMSSPSSDVTQNQLAALRQQRQAQQGSFFDSSIFKPIEWVGSKIYQVYSDTLSPAVSFAELEAKQAFGNTFGGKDYINDPNLGLGDEWELAHHVSPGQALWLIGMTEKQQEKSGLTQAEMLKQEKQVKAGTFQAEKTAQDPFGMETNVQKYFSKGAAKWVSGSADFALSWYADPTVLAGKALGAAKLAKVTRPIAKAISKETKALPVGLTAEDANKMAWDNFTTKQPFQNLTDSLWDIKQANPDTAAARLNRDVPTIAKSANGPAVARLISQAGSKSEVANILRVTMGDDVANEALKVQNGEIAYQLKQLNNRYASVGQYYNGLTDAEKASPGGVRTKALMDAQSSDMAKLDQDSQIISDKVDAFGAIGNLNYNKITTPAGMKLRAGFQASRDWRPFEDGGFIKSNTNNIYSLSLGGVIKLVHAYNDIKPSHLIDVNDTDGWRQLQASLFDVKGLTPAARDMYVSQYLNAPQAMRASALVSIEQKITRNLVDRYNLKNGLVGTGNEISHDVANSLYQEVASRRSSAQGAMNREQYGTASVDNPDLPGTTVRVDEITPDGGKLIVTPLLRTQMANSHAMMDFGLFQKALNANASTWQKALNHVGPGWEQAVGLADYVGSIWKFAQLFRLGYGPRAMADDGLGQIARFGPLAMMERALKGGKYSWETLRRAATPDAVFDNAMVARGHLEVQMSDLTNQQKTLQEKIATAHSEGRHTDIPGLQDQLKDNIDDLASARSSHADMDKLVRGGAAMKAQRAGGQIWSAPYAGAQGGLFRDLASGEKNFGNMMGSAADSYLKRLRKMDWEQLSPAKHGEDVHMNAWMDVLNKQVAHDALASQYLKGRTPQQLERWLSSPEGLAYKRNHTIASHLPNDQLVERVTTQLDEWANPAFPGGDVIRQAASKGEVTKDMLKEVPAGARPLVNGQALSYARGSHDAMQLINRGMDAWYRLAGSAPNRILLRNPLFAQRYKVHLQDLMTTSGVTGETRMTEDLRQQFESAARQRALSDVKKNTFTMDYETKMSYMLRNFGAFFGAQQESWNRWARIISDKPDILARVPQVMGAPTRVGLTTDANGNRIGADGYVTDPTTGQRRLVPYNERHTVIQIPDYLGGKQFKKFFGLDPNATFNIPMSTANIILNHGDGPLPVSAGPYVQMAANNLPFTDLDANGNPKLADMYQSLGILPFGATPSNMDAFLPNWFRKAEAGDTMSGQYQQNLWYIMQAENYKYKEGLRKTAPTWPEISDRATKQSWMKVLFAATLPVSLSAKDPYDYFRNQYRQMQKVDSTNADQNFYDKFGDSAYIFSKSLSQNNSGLKPTAEAVGMSKYYQDLVAKAGPEWAGLIVGAEGDGNYSNGAFYYEKTHQTDPASGQTMRSTMSARDALKAANTSLGWQQYKGEMNRLYSELYAAGFQTFDDPGAEDIKAQKTALVQVLSAPQTLDDNGNLTTNQYYNEDWSKAYNSLDTSYYDRAAASLRHIVDDPEIWSKAVNPDGSIGMRSDIYRLKQYLTYRDSAKRALLVRQANGGSSDISAAENADIKGQWDSMVVGLVQQDTKFGDLFNRYLSRDMGFDKTSVQQQAQTGQLQQFQGNVNQAPTDQTQSIFDQLAQQG